MFIFITANMIYIDGYGAINGSARFLTPAFEITPAGPLTCVRFVL